MALATMTVAQRSFVALVVVASACTAFSNVDLPNDAASGTGAMDGSVGGSTISGGASFGASAGIGANAGTGGTGGAAGTVAGGGGSAPTCTGCGSSECECSPAAPTGWTHVRIVETLDGSAPACPTGYSKSAVAIGEGALDTGCGACTCGAFDAASAGSCNEVWQWGGLCNGAPIAKSAAGSGQCVKLSGTSVKLGVSGTCPASAPPNPPKFSKTVTLCEAASFGSGCDKDACIAVPKPPFESARCLVSQIDGDQACPSGFPIKRSYNVTFTDARVCTGCTCDLTSVSCSGGSSKWCTDGSCGNCPYSSSIPGNCFSDDGFAFWVFSGSANPSSGSCTPSGTASSSGTVTASGVRVVCCV